MVRSGSGHDDVGVHCGVVVLVATFVEPCDGAVLRPLEAANHSVHIHRRVIDVQSNATTQQRWAQPELQFPAYSTISKLNIQFIQFRNDFKDLFEGGTGCAPGVRHRSKTRLGSGVDPLMGTTLPLLQQGRWSSVFQGKSLS